MPYTPDTWANNDPTKPLNAARLTKLAGQYPQVMADLPAKIADSGDPIGAALNSTFVPIPPGGTTGQALVKAGSDIEWGDVEGGGEVDPATLRLASSRGGVAAPGRKTGAVIAFTFDDGYATDLSVVKPILDAQGIKGTFGILTGLVGTSGRLTWAQVRQLRDEGHEIANHSVTHISLSGVSAATLDAEIAAADAAIRAEGIIPTGFIWPNGSNDAAARTYVRTYAPYALAGSGTNSTPIATYSIGRLGLSSTSVLGDMTAAIDDAIANDRFLVFLIHSGTGLDSTGQSVLNSTIDYAQAASVPILTVSQALDRVGNVYDAGDYPNGTNYHVVDRLGRAYSKGSDEPILYAGVNAFTASSLPSDFTNGKITVMAVSGSNGWPVTSTGNVVTNRFESSNAVYATQQFTASDGTAYWRRASGASTWGSWNTWPTMYQGSITLSTIPTSFTNPVTVTPITDTSGPSATPGILLTIRASSASWYHFQLFLPYNNAAQMYFRTATGGGSTWGTWIDFRDTITATTAQLEAVGNAINTVSKKAGRMVFNTTTNKPVWATGSNANSTWVDATGTTAHTPV